MSQLKNKYNKNPTEINKFIIQKEELLCESIEKREKETLQQSGYDFVNSDNIAKYIKNFIKKYESHPIIIKIKVNLENKFILK